MEPESGIGERDQVRDRREDHVNLADTRLGQSGAS